MSQNVAVGLFILAAVLLVMSIIRAIHANDCLYDDKAAAVYNSCKKTIKIVCVLFVIACLLPSRQTVYMVAGSELGETALKSETGAKAVKALNRYLDGIGTDTSTK